VGAGFEVPVNPLEANCASVIASFGEDPTTSARLGDLGDLDLALYTMFRPVNMAPGEKFPLITWGDGTCAQPLGYGVLLHYVASHGFFVIAANSRYTMNGAMITALDYAFAANEDPASPYYQRIDTTKVGAMGHSQGGGATIAAASDPRVKAVIIWNGGSSAVKPFFAISGDNDIGGGTAASLASAVARASQPGAWLFFHQVPQTGLVSGHLTLMMEPERVTEFTVAWWQYQLNGDTAARDFFVGDNCTLCNRDEEFEYGQQGLN